MTWLRVEYAAHPQNMSHTMKYIEGWTPLPNCSVCDTMPHPKVVR